MICKLLFGWEIAYLQLVSVDEWKPTVFKTFWWLIVVEKILNVPKEYLNLFQV